MARIAVIVGCTRPGRVARAVGDWVFAARRTEASYELVDLADFNLPLLDEELPAALGRYAGEHTKRWAATIAAFDGYVVVTPEYNHGPGAALKNAFDYVYAEWQNKTIGFVSYGAAGGVRAVEHLRLVAAELSLASVSAQLVLPIASDFPGYPQFTQIADRELLGQVESWSDALSKVRG
jgi:NAD(P)H-dependent FMN reductase